MEDILEKAQGTVFRLVRKSFGILLISLANLFLVVQRRAILVVTVSFLHHLFAALPLEINGRPRQAPRELRETVVYPHNFFAEVVSADGFSQTAHLG